MRLLIILCVAAACAVLTNVLRENPLPWVEAWSDRVEAKAQELELRIVEVPEAEQIVEEGIYFIFDARGTEYFEEGHLPLAMSLPESEFDEKVQNVLSMLIPEQEIMVYCSGADCDESLLVAKHLVDMGYTNVALFAAGYDAWVEAGLPVEEGL